MSTKTVLCFSGGLDSSVLLYYLRKLGHEVHCLSVDYGQRHRRELDAALQVAACAGSPFRRLDLSSLGEMVMYGSSQTSEHVAVPEGHYAEESMKQTVVPNRNMVLLSLATALAVSLRAQHVAYAAHQGDHAIYPDCRSVFADAMGEAVRLCDWHPPNLVRPFVGLTKAEIVKRGVEVGAPMGLTYSCYKGGPKHCGKCGTCVERREAFQVAGVPDPTEYEDDLPSHLPSER